MAKKQTKKAKKKTKAQLAAEARAAEERARLLEAAETLATGGLCRLSELLGLYPQRGWVPIVRPFAFDADDLQECPEAEARVRAIDPAELLARSLRVGLLQELCWPAYEEARAELEGDGGTVRATGAYPVLALYSPVRAIVVGARERLLEHRFSLPEGYEVLTLDYVAGKLLVRGKADEDDTDGLAYWSDRPEVQEACGGFGRSRIDWARIDLGDAVSYGGYLLRGATAPGEVRTRLAKPLIGDGAAWWNQEGHEPFDPGSVSFASARDDFLTFVYDLYPEEGGGRSRLAFAQDVFLEHYPDRWSDELLELDLEELADLLDEPSPSGAAPPWLSEPLEENWRLDPRRSWILPAPEEAPLGAREGRTGLRCAVGPGERLRAEAVTGEVWEGTLPTYEAPAGLVWLPGDDAPRLLSACADSGRPCHADRGLALSDPSARECVQACERRPWEPVAVDPHLLPLPFFASFQARDEAGSRALRAVEAEALRPLLRAETADAQDAALAGALPALTDPALRAEVLARAERARACAAGLARLVPPPGEPGAPPPLSDKALCRVVEPLLGGFGFAAQHSAVAQLGAVFPWLLGEAPAPATIPETWVDWVLLTDVLAAVAVRAASAALPERSRATHLAFLRHCARAGIGRVPPGHLRLGRNDDAARPLALTEVDGRRRFLKGAQLVEVGPPGLPGKWEEVTVRWGTEAQVEAFAAALAERGPVEVTPEQVEALVARGCARPLAVVALHAFPVHVARARGEPEPPDAEQVGLDARRRKAFGVKVGELRDAARIKPTDRREALGRLRPEDVWDPEAYVEQLAAAMTARGLLAPG